MKTVQNYIKNVAKSIVFSAADTTKNLMPEVGTFAENNKEFFATSYSALKNPGAAAKKTIGNIQESKIFQAIDYGARNLVEDLKTGNFYNKERDMKDSGKLSGFGTDDWDDLSEFGVDADWEKNLGKVASENDTITKGDKQIIEAVNDSSEVSTKTTVNTIIKTSQMQMDNQRASTAILYQQNEKLMNGLHSDLNVVNTTLTGINNMLVTSMQNIDTNMANYFTEEIKLSQERNAILKEMLEMQRNQYKSAAEKEEETNNKRYKGHKARWSDISLSGGSINLNAYFDNVKKNIKDELNNSGFGMMFGGFGDDSNMLAAAMTSPLKSITELITNAIIPATVKEAAKEFSGTLSGAFGTAIARLSNAANDDESGILGILGRFLGVNTKVNKNIDTSRYEKGPVPWDGIARKALIDVIPTYLRQLVSILSGSPERVYDYNAGRWYDLHEGKKALEDIHKNAVDRGVGSLRRTMQHGQEAITFNSKTDKEDFDKAWDEFWEYIYENNGQFDPNKTIEQNHIGYEHYRIRKYYPILCTIWQESSKGVYTDTSGRRRTRSNYAEKMQLGGNVMNAKKGEEDDYREAEANGGLINAHSSNARGKEPSYNERTKQYNYTTILDVKDKDTGLSIFGYLNETLKMLEWQVEHWGGKKEGSGAGNSNNLESARNINTKTKIKRDADKREDEAYARENRNYLEEIEEGYKKGKKFDYEKIIKGFEKQGKDKQDEEARRIAMAYVDFMNKHAADEQASEVNSYVNESGLTKLADKWYQAEIGLDEKQLKELEEGLKKDGVSPNKPAEGFMAKFFNTLKATGSASKAIASGSAEVVTNMLYMADQAVYNMFFKSEVKDGEGNKYSSFTEFLTGKFSETFSNLKDKLKENFLDPIKDRLKQWFDENFKQDFVGTMKNAGKKTWQVVKSSYKDVYGGAINKIRGKNKNNENTESEDEEDEEEESDGTIGGALNKVTRKAKKGAKKVKDNLVTFVGNSKDKIIKIARNFRNGSGSNDETSTSAYGRGYFSGNTMLSRNEVVLNNNGARRVSGTGLYSINEPSVILNSSQAYDAGFTSARGNPKADLSAERRMAHGMGLATNAEGTVDNSGVTKAEITEYVNEAKTTAKNNKGGLVAGGVIGGAVSTVLGLVGGPLIGAAVGAGTTLIARSDKFKDIIFGKTDENGERQGGMISKGVMDTVKKYAPDAMKFGIAGILPGLILPFGPLGGMMIGAGIGILKNNENFMNKYFGEGGLLHFTDKEKKTVMKLLPGAGKGAAVGAIGSLLFSGIGMLPAAAVGSVVGMMTTTDEFKEGILGRKVNGIRVGGLLNGIKDTFKPLGDVFIDFGKRMRDLLDDGVVKPIKEFLVPAIHGLPKALGRIPGMINNAFGEKFGRSLSGMLADVVKGPVARVASVALTPVRAAANVATVPFRGLGAIGNRMRRRQINTGNADYMTAEERITWMQDHGYDDQIEGFDKSLAAIGTEGGISIDEAKSLRSNLGKISTTKNQAFNAANKQWKAVEKYLDKYVTTNGGSISPKSKKSIRNALEKGDEDGARNLIRGAVVRGSKTTLSNADIEKLYQGQEGSAGLDTLLKDFTSANDIYQSVKDENDASKNDRMAEIQKSFEALGVKDIDLTNVNSVRKYMKLLDTEITSRENGEEGINLDQDNNDQLHNIVELLAKQIEVSEDIAAGNTEEYKSKSNERKNRREASRVKDKEFEDQRNEAVKDMVGYSKYNQFTPETQDALTRTTKHGYATKFTRMAASRDYSADIVNAVNGEYSKELGKIMAMGFDITPEAAKMIAHMSDAEIKEIDSFFDKNVAYVFGGHKITTDDLAFCKKNYTKRETFKQRCRTIAKSNIPINIHGDNGEVTDRFTSFSSIFPTSKEEQTSLDELLINANSQINKAKRPMKGIKVFEKGPLQMAQQFVKRRADILHALKNEKYEFTDEAEDYLWSLDVLNSGKVAKFFNRYMKQIYGNGKHTFTVDDIKALQDYGGSVFTSKQFRQKLKAVVTSGGTAEEYPTIEIINGIDEDRLKDLKKKGRMNTQIGMYVRKFMKPMAKMFNRIFGAHILTELKREGFEFEEAAEDLLDNIKWDPDDNHTARNTYRYFNKDVLAYYRGYKIKASDIEYILNDQNNVDEKEFKNRCKILSRSNKYRDPKLSFKGIMSLDEAEIEMIKSQNNSRRMISKLIKPFKRIAKKIKLKSALKHNAGSAWKAAGFYLSTEAQQYISNLGNSKDPESQEKLNILNKYLTARTAKFFKDYLVQVKDLQYCIELGAGNADEFNDRCQILVDAKKTSVAVLGDNKDSGTQFEKLMNMSQEELAQYKKQRKTHNIFQAMAQTIRNRRGGSTNGRIGKGRVRLRNLFNGDPNNKNNKNFVSSFGQNIINLSGNGGEENNQDNEGTVATNGIGTMIISGIANGAKAVGKAAVNGAKAVGNAAINGINNLRDKKGNGGFFKNRRGGGPVEGAAEGGLNGAKNAAAGVIDFGRGRIGKARIDSSGSIIPDTSDSKTKEYVDEIEQEKTTNEKLVEAQLATAEELKQSNDTDEYNKGGKKMSWIKLLLIGGLLWKSGILKKLYEGFIKPLWTDLIKPWITDKAIPWITDTFIPALGTLLGNILPGIIKTGVKLALNIGGGFLDFISGGNKTNAGASTTVSASTFEGKTGNSNYYDETGNTLTYEDIQAGNFEKIFNKQGAEGTVEYDDDGNITGITFEDSSRHGAGFLQNAAHATAVGFTSAGGSKILAGAGQLATKLVQSNSTVGKIAGATLGVTRAPQALGKNLRTMVSNIGKNKSTVTAAAEAATDTAKEVAEGSKSVFTKAKQLIDKFFGSDNPRINKKITQFASEYAGDEGEQMVMEEFKDNITKSFKDASDQITTDAVKNNKGLLNQLRNIKVTTIIFMVVDFLLGMDRAESILGVSEVGVGEQIIAGILNAVINQIPILNMVPGAKWIIKHIFQWFDKLRPNQEKTIAERQAEADAEAEAYNEENGTTYSTEEYLAKTKSISGKVVTKVTGAVKKGWQATKNFFKSGGIKNAASKAVDAVKNVATKRMERTQARVEKTKDVWQNISGKLKNMFKAADDGDVDALDESAEDEDDDSSGILSMIKSMVGPKALLSRSMKALNASSGITAKLFGDDDDQEVIEKAKNGEISVFSKEYWQQDDESDDSKSTFGKVFKKTKSFIVRLTNAPMALIQGTFAKLNNTITNFKEAFAEKFPNLAAFLDHPFKWIWQHITGTYDNGDGEYSETGGYSRKSMQEKFQNGEIASKDDTYWYSDVVGSESGTYDNGDGGTSGYSETGGYSLKRKQEKFQNGEIASKDGTYWYSDVVGSESGEGKHRRSKFGKGYVKQIDPSIRNLPFNVKGDHEKQTIGDSACGPAAAVNAVKAYYGRGSSELVSAANMAINGGYKEIDGGTYPEYFTDYFAQNGLGSTISTNKDNIADRIRSGQPTVLMGRDARGTSSSNPFGTQSHYVTVTGLDGRGRAIVQDPESRYDNQLYDVDDIISKTQLGISAYGKFGRHFGRSKFHHYGHGKKYGRGKNNGNGVIFITDAAGAYIKELMDDNDQDVGGCYDKAQGFSEFCGDDHPRRNKGAKYIGKNCAKHQAVVIMLGLCDIQDNILDNYKNYVNYINSVFNTWNLDVYVVSVNPVGSDCSFTKNTTINTWNANMNAKIKALNNDRVHFINTYTLIRDTYTIDNSKTNGDMQGQKYGGEPIFFDDTTNEAIYSYIIEQVIEYSGEEAVASNANGVNGDSVSNAKSISNGIFEYISDWVMDNTNIGTAYKLIFGGDDSDDEDEESDEEEEYDEEELEEALEDESGEGKFGRGKNYPASKIINKINNYNKNNHGRGKYYHAPRFGRGIRLNNGSYNTAVTNSYTHSGARSSNRYKRIGARGKNYIYTARSKFNHYKYGRHRFGRGDDEDDDDDSSESTGMTTGNGVIFITDAAGKYIKDIMKDTYGQDVGGCYKKPKGYTYFSGEDSTAKARGGKYIDAKCNKHAAAVIMLGMYEIANGWLDYYKKYAKYIGNSIKNWDLDVYVVSVNPVGDGGDFDNNTIHTWNNHMLSELGNLGNSRIHYIDTYALIKDTYVIDNDRKGSGVYKNQPIFFDDDTNEAICEFILQQVGEYSGEDAIATSACDPNAISNGIFEYISDWVMDNTSAGAVYKLIFGGDSSSDEDESTDTTGEEDEEEEEITTEELEEALEDTDYDDDNDDDDNDDDDSGEGKYGRGKYSRNKYGKSKKHHNLYGRSKYHTSTLISRLNKANKAAKGKYGRGKYGRGNPEKIWYVLKHAGLTEQGAAGLMGNMQAESGMAPNNVQDSYESAVGDDETYTNAVDNGSYRNFANDEAGYGLCQWTYCTRKQNLYNYAKDNNASIADLAMQLSFLISELSSGFSSVLETLKSTNNVTEASNTVLNRFENPSDQSVSVQNARAAMGQQWYDELKGTEGEACEIGDGYDNLTGTSSSSSSGDTTSDMTSIINKYLANTTANQVYTILTGNSLVEGGDGSTSSGSSGSSSGDGSGNAMVEAAKPEIGVAETPENYVKYNEWFYGNNASQPWCAAFVSWCADQAGVLGTALEKTAACQTEHDYILKNGGKSVKASEAQPGDIVYFTNTPGYASGIYHTGIVEKLVDNTLYTIEGNYSDKVSENKFATSNSSLIIDRPAYPKSNDDSSSSSSSTDEEDTDSDDSDALNDAPDVANTLGGNGYKPVSKYGTFRRSMYGTGQRFRLKNKDGSGYVERTDVDRDLGLEARREGVDTKVRYGKGTSYGNTDNYTNLLEAVLKVLVTIADNTDRLNTIVNLITNYIDLHSSDTDVADATKAKSLKNSLNGIMNGSIAGSSSANKLSSMADNIADGSIAAIINAMNAIASE